MSERADLRRIMRRQTRFLAYRENSAGFRFWRTRSECWFGQTKLFLGDSHAKADVPLLTLALEPSPELAEDGAVEISYELTPRQALDVSAVLRRWAIGMRKVRLNTPRRTES